MIVCFQQAQANDIVLASHIIANKNLPKENSFGKANLMDKQKKVNDFASAKQSLQKAKAKLEKAKTNVNPA